MKINGLLAIGVSALLLVLFSGCPDRSYMRPVPDYDNMVDHGDGEAEQEDTRGETDEYE